MSYKNNFINLRYLNKYKNLFMNYFNLFSNSESLLNIVNPTTPTEGGNSSINIVTEGLILNLDASNPLSYPGAGTTWSDLSGNNNNGTLSTPTYSTSGGGSFSFVPSVDYVDCGSGISALNLQQLSISFWLKPGTIVSDVDNYLFSLDSVIGTSAYYGVGIDLNNLSTDSYSISSSIGDGYFIYSGNRKSVQSTDRIITKNIWQMITFVYTSAQSVELYLNDTKITNLTYSGGYNGSTIGSSHGAGKTRIAHRWGGVSNPNSFNGFMNDVMVYNKPLTASEITQNYNANKNKYI